MQPVLITIMFQNKHFAVMLPNTVIEGGLIESWPKNVAGQLPPM